MPHGVVVGLGEDIACVDNESGFCIGYAALELEYIRCQVAMPSHGRFNFYGNEFALPLKNQVDFVAMTVLPEIQVRLPTGIEACLECFCNNKVLEKVALCKCQVLVEICSG